MQQYRSGWSGKSHGVLLTLGVGIDWRKVMILVTAEFIRAGKPAIGAWCAAQLKLIGVSWPPVAGWIDRTDAQGVMIDDLSADLFLGYAAGTVTKSQIRRHNSGKAGVLVRGAVDRSDETPRNRKKKLDAKKAEAEFFASDGFLRSAEWKFTRYEALLKYKAKCACCGATAKDGAKLNVDHIKPRKTHPELALDINNLQVLCGDCNRGKGNRDSTDWRPSSAK